MGEKHHFSHYITFRQSQQSLISLIGNFMAESKRECVFCTPLCVSGGLSKVFDFRVAQTSGLRNLKRLSPGMV